MSLHEELPDIFHDLQALLSRVTEAADESPPKKPFWASIALDLISRVGEESKISGREMREEVQGKLDRAKAFLERENCKLDAARETHREMAKLKHMESYLGQWQTHG